MREINITVQDFNMFLDPAAQGRRKLFPLKASLASTAKSREDVKG